MMEDAVLGASTCSAPLYISYLIGQAPSVGVALTTKYVYPNFTLGDLGGSIDL